MAEQMTRCFRCGRRTSSREKVCGDCGVCLLVDVVVDGPAPDARTVYVAAREIDALGGRVPTFDTIKSGLEKPPATLVADCTRHLSGSIVEILRRHGIAARKVPVRRVRGAGDGSAGPVVGDRAGQLAARFRRLPTAVKAAFAVASVVVIGVVLFGGERGDDGSRRSGSDSRALKAMSSQEIVFAALPATAQLRCADSTGVGFFVEPNLLVTCIDVVSSEDAGVEVSLADGRILVAHVESKDDWLGLVTLRADGADVASLRLGDATGLEQGEMVLSVISPTGDGLSVGQSIISDSSRVVMGLSYLQLDSEVVPGSVGGPVLDRWGRVAGILAGAVPADGGLGLAVPVNYLFSGDDPLLSVGRAADEESRWQALVTEVSDGERSELAGMVQGAARPALVHARLVRAGAVEVIVARIASSHPAPERLELALLSDAGPACTLFGEVSWWRPVEERRDLVGGSRYLSWLARHDLLPKVFVGRSLLNTQGCEAGVVVGSSVRLNRGFEGADRAAIRVGGLW